MMGDSKNIIACDLLIIGGGLAAATAAKCALYKDIDVCQVVKGSYGAIGQRGAGASCSGASESGHPRLARASINKVCLDSLFQMIIQAGMGMVDRKLASALVEDFPRIQRQLKKWDIRFDTDGPYHLGYPFVHTLDPQIRSSRIRLFEHTMIADLLIEDGRCAGAVGVTRNGEIYLFHAPAVILATGGNAQLFKHNVHPACVTGDGYAMGFRIGAELMNVEFMQIFFCTVHPTRNLFHAWNKALTVRSEKSLNTLLSDIHQLHEEIRHGLSVVQPSDLIGALELKNLLLVGELVAEAALKREESRGGHYREDFPECDHHAPAKAIVLSQAKDGSLLTKDVAIDPLWQYDEAGLGNGRWG